MSLPIKLPSRYAYSEKMFSGGQGNVYVCKDLNLDRSVAIKTLKGVSNAQSLRAELRAISSIRSKHVVECYGVINDNDSNESGLVLEYVPGKDLADVTYTDLSAYVKDLYQIAAGLADIHAAGLIHRDIKPKNMKYDGEGIIKIFDLGLSCIQDDAETTALRGTKHFRGPEYFETAPVTLCRGADVYAFGVTAWLLSVGALPWQLRNMPTRSKPDSFGTHSLSLPSRIVKLLDSCFEENPGDRPQMIEIRDALKSSILHGKHIGRIMLKGKRHELKTVNQVATLSIANMGHIDVKYDGYCFIVNRCGGDVFINGAPASAGDELPGSSVITFGAEALGWQRLHTTLDVSHPEVII